jgi:hypothetical protein
MALVVLAAAITVYLYREAISFPFLFDDMIHLRWLDWHSPSEVWTTAEGLGYYRPLTMSVWKFAHLLLGRNDPRILHTLNLVLHSLNGVLTGLIAWRAYQGKGQKLYVILAALLFLAFPFSYQAVPSTSSLSKPLIATLTLGSALLYWDARRRHSAWQLAGSLFLAFLAPFAYETGIVVPIAIISVELLGYSRQEFERLSWFPLLFMVIVWAIALPIVLVMEPESGASVSVASPTSLWRNGIYFLEGLLYPIAPLGTPLERLLKLDQYVLVFLLEAMSFAAMALIYRWASRLSLFLYALSWFAAGILPQWAMLDFSYVITSPRILYLAAVGSALIWAGLPVFLWLRLPSRWWSRVLPSVLAVGVLTFGIAYVRDKMIMARTAAAPLWQAALAAQIGEGSRNLLYLNVPAWIAPKEATYRIGTEGLTFIPQYVRVEDFVYVMGATETSVQAFRFDPVAQDWEDYIGYAGDALEWDALTEEIRRASSVHRTTYTPQGLDFVEAGSVEPTDNRQNTLPVLASFAEQILLLDYHTIRTEDGLSLVLSWSSDQVPDRDLTAFVHVYDELGQILAQADGYPLLGLYPPARWRTLDIVRDIRYLSLPEDMEEGQFSVAVGWYDPGTGQRLPAFDADGQRLPQDALPLPPKR